MAWHAIVKSKSLRVAANLENYEQTRASFSWQRARSELTGLPNGGGLNIAYEAVDRHAAGPRKDHLAIRWLGKNGECKDYSYGQLARPTNRFANVLRGLGIGQGDRVYALLGRIPELYIATLDAEKSEHLLSDVLRIWTRANPRETEHRPGEGSSDDGISVPAKSGEHSCDAA